MALDGITVANLAHDIQERLSGGRISRIAQPEADALLLTSVSEGSPQVIKEALACGLPIVSVDVGDVKERTDGVEGCYVASSRDPEELAGLLKTALSFDGRTKGREALLRDGLTSDAVAGRLLDVYKKVLAQ